MLHILKQGSFWSLLILAGIQALLAWLIWFAGWNYGVENIQELYQYVLIILFIIVGMLIMFWSMYKQFRNIRW
jgi:hypothetical protein